MQALAAGPQFSAMGQGILYMPLHLVDRCGIDQRPLLRDSRKAIADDQSRDLGAQPSTNSS